MRLLRLSGIVLLLAAVSLAHATSSSIDISDLWWAPDEPGWGMQIVHSYDTAFVTIYVYRSDRSPVWYSATIKGSVDDIGGMSGDLYETSGPYFGAASFNPSSVMPRKVGIFRFQDPYGDASIDYSVDGVAVHKDVVRQSLVNEDNSGQYRGMVNAAVTDPGCGIYTTGQGLSGEVQIAQPGRGQAITLTLQFGSQTCTMANGEYGQDGRYGFANGGVLCAGGDQGTLNLYEMRTGSNTFTTGFYFKSDVTGCRLYGTFAGVRL